MFATVDISGRQCCKYAKSSAERLIVPEVH